MSVQEGLAGRMLVSPWWISLGSGLALIVVNGSISLFSFGVFIKPLETEFGWDRGALSSALALCAICSAISLPFVGVLMDRFGVKPVMLTSIVVFAVNIAAISLSTTLVTFILLTGLTGITGVGQGPTGYVKSISSYFDSRRGVALGLAVSGTGVGNAFLPQYAQWLISHVGWRFAYVGLSLALIIIAVPAILIFVREPSDSPMARVRRVNVESVGDLPGLSIRQALTSRTFWVLITAVILVSTVVNGCVVHTVSLLTDRGWSPQAAAGIMVWAGLASLIGRLIAGYLLDKVFAPYVAGCSFLFALGGMYLLASDINPLLGVIGIGLTTGAEIDIIAFMTSRYFGFRRFGQIYGYIFGVFLIGAGIGPMIMGATQTRFHSYDAAFWGFGFMLAAASLLMLFLRDYTYPPESIATNLDEDRARVLDAHLIG